MRQEVRPTAGLQPPAVISFSQVSVQVATQAGAGGSARLVCAGAACADAATTAMRAKRKRQRRIATPQKFPNQPSWVFVCKSDGGIAMPATKKQRLQDVGPRKRPPEDNVEENVAKEKGRPKGRPSHWICQ